MVSPKSLIAPFLLLPIVAAAQTNLERIVNDAYTRSHDYDLVHQLIEVRDFDWDSTSFNGRVTTTLVALRPGLDSIILDCGKLLRIDRVTAVGGGAKGAALRFTRHGDTLVVYPARPLAFRDTTRFLTEYGGKVDNGRGLTFIAPEGLPHRPQQIWSQGEDMNSHYWFPTYDFPNDKMTWELNATVPAAYTVVSNGREVSDRKNADGTHTAVWRQDLPASTYLVSLIVAPLARLTDAWHGIPVKYFVYHEDSSIARRVFSMTPDMIDVYSRLTGVDYPWAQYAQTTVADFFGGMENVSATTLVDWLPDARAYQDRPWYQWILIPHELAHQWFGDYTTTENWANFWLNEGFAEFMPGQYWRAKLGPQAADDYYVEEYEHFLQIDQRRRMPLAAKASNNIYPKGALVLRMLERLLGPDRFWASLHTYLTRHALGNATSDDLRQAVLDATGENLDWFWSEWVYQAGYPELTVTAAYDAGGRAVTLTVTQTQPDSARADSTGLRYGTPQVFRMPLAIRVGMAKGEVVQRVTLDQRSQAFTIPGITSPPTMIIFDDGNAVLKRLTFDEPTAWLATQLERDDDLWNRFWVIGQLAQRPTDSLAGRALARAATGADYYLTRAQAAEALGRFADAVARPALETAASDTSSSVRQSALLGLTELGGDRTAAIARGAFRKDSSYEVRGAAVAALAITDPDARDSTLRAALATPSYRDEIRNAALRVIIQLNDTGYIGLLESMLGEYENAAHGLAVLANRGSATALQVLTRHLDDERPAARRYVLDAFRSTLAPDQALRELRAAQDKLRYADTRKRAAIVVQQLERKAGG